MTRNRPLTIADLTPAQRKAWARVLAHEPLEPGLIEAILEAEQELAGEADAWKKAALAELRGTRRRA